MSGSGPAFWQTVDKNRLVMWCWPSQMAGLILVTLWPVLKERYQTTVMLFTIRLKTDPFLTLHNGDEAQVIIAGNYLVEQNSNWKPRS